MWVAVTHRRALASTYVHQRSGVFRVGTAFFGKKKTVTPRGMATLLSTKTVSCRFLWLKRGFLSNLRNQKVASFLGFRVSKVT